MFHLFRRSRLVPKRRNTPIRRQPLVLELLEDRLTPSTLLVTNASDSGVSGDGSLRGEILAANTNVSVSNTIQFKSTLSGDTISLTNVAGQLSITKSLTITGLGSNHLTVEGTNGNRVFYINGGGTAAKVTISGLTITNDGSTVSGDGGGILVAGSKDSLTLASSFVGGPTVGSGIHTDGSGGGVASLTGSSGSLTIQGSTISGNTTDDDNGGGVYVENGTTTITNSTIENNSDTFAGGGLFVVAGTLKVSGSTITGNTVGGEGGGIYFGQNSNAVSLTITNSTITGNHAATSDDLDGGGVCQYHGTLNVQNSTISGNTLGSSGGSDGGGIAFKGSTFLISGSQINNNVPANDSLPGINNGAGLYLKGSGTISGTTISGNTASNGGGGIFFTGGGKLTVQNCTINGNTAQGEDDDGGGGINVQSGNLTVINSTISGSNMATHSGGGIYFEGGGTLTVESSTISGNTAEAQNDGYGGGGGIYVDDGTLYLVNSTISGNTADASNGGYGGGGVYFYGGRASEEGPFRSFISLNSTIANNFVTNNSGSGGGDGAGIFLESGTTSLYNTIVANNHLTSNSGSPVLDDLFRNAERTTTFSAFYSLIRIVTNESNLINGTSMHNLFGVDPKLGPLQNNGGPTQTLALLSGSPAIDHGNNNYVTNPPITAAEVPNIASILLYDQRGPGFPRIENGIVDIGAFEVQIASPLNRRWNR